jgi:FAD/FMN-containing dehydrogenase
MAPLPTPTPTPLSLAPLRAAVDGRVIAPGDAEYNAARAVVTGGIDRHPAVIVRAANAADVARVIGVARATGLELAVRSGGHSGAGHGTTEGGIVLDLSAMKGIEVDLDDRTVWAGAGLTAGELTVALHADGVAVGFGDTASVGIGGITTGGGIGYLVRKHGLTIDSLLAVDMVTAAGELVRADAVAHPDLFWAIRGGGGNFGVVTRFEFRLHEVGTVMGGMLILPATAATLAGFIAAAEAAPDELSTIANVMPAPPMPFLAPERHGKLVVMAQLVHVGDLDAGQAAVAPFRALAEPLADLVRPMAYPEMYPPDDAEYRPLALVKTLFMDHVGLDDAAAILARLETSDAPMRVVQLRVLGGAMARVPADATAFAHRASRILAVVVALHDGTSEERAKRQDWVDELAATLCQDDVGAYVSFLADEGEARVRAAYPGATWNRLVAIKRRYDPTNLFRLNQNVPPDGGES